MHVFIDGGNIGINLPHFLLGLCKIKGQGIEVGFKVLAMGVGHDEGGKQKGTVGRSHRKGFMGEGYHDDQGDKGNPMG
jgi:hypothetical protein